MSSAFTCFADTKTLADQARTGSGVCLIYSTEGTDSPLELDLFFVGDTGYEVGAPLDLSKFKRSPWTANDEAGKPEVLGVIYKGKSGLRLPRLHMLAVLAACLQHPGLTWQLYRDIQLVTGDACLLNPVRH